MSRRTTTPREHLLRPRSEAESILEDIAPYLGRDLAFHARMLASVCDAAAAIIASRPDRDRVLAYRDPRSPESEQLWLRLVEEHRKPDGA